MSLLSVVMLACNTAPKLANLGMLRVMKSLDVLSRKACATLQILPFRQPVIMESDCCGGAESPSAAQQAQAQLQRLAVGDALREGALQKPTAATPLARSPEEMVKEKQPYYQNRIQLFQQYRARQQRSVEEAKAANKPLKGLANVLPTKSFRCAVSCCPII